jgi:hypothetical protein
MSELRKMNVVVTLMISVDIVTKEENSEAPKSEITLSNVANQVMATVIPLGGAAETSAEFRNACATLAVKEGLAFMLNDLNGEHKKEAPKTNSPGADA